MFQLPEVTFKERETLLSALLMRIHFLDAVKDEQGFSHAQKAEYKEVKDLYNKFQAHF